MTRNEQLAAEIAALKGKRAASNSSIAETIGKAVCEFTTNGASKMRQGYLTTRLEYLKTQHVKK